MFDLSAVYCMIVFFYTKYSIVCVEIFKKYNLLSQKSDKTETGRKNLRSGFSALFLSCLHAHYSLFFTVTF